MTWTRRRRCTSAGARRLLDVDQSVPSPSDSREPRARRRNRRRLAPRRHCSPPAVEPSCRRPRVHAAHAANVLLHVRQDVHERVAHLARRREQPRVVPVGPDGAASTECAVARSRDADRESLDAPHEPSRLVRLDDEMHVVALHGKVKDAKRIVRGRRQGRGDGGKHVIRAKRGQAGVCTQRHVGRASRHMPIARTVRHPRSTGGGFAPGTITRTAPGALPEGEGKLSPVNRHLNRQ